MISPDYVLCYIPRAMAIISWKWKFWNLLVRRRRPLWCQWRPLYGFGNFGKKILNFGIFFRNFEYFENFWKLWVIISKVGSIFWRWEGYIRQKKTKKKQYFSVLTIFNIEDWILNIFRYCEKVRNLGIRSTRDTIFWALVWTTQALGSLIKGQHMLPSLSYLLWFTAFSDTL